MMTDASRDPARTTADERLDYRIDFFNTFARNSTTRRVCQRSIVVRDACCPGHARKIAETRFAQLENVGNWRIRATEVEVVPLERRRDDPGAGRAVSSQAADSAEAAAKPSPRVSARRRE